MRDKRAFCLAIGTSDSKSSAVIVHFAIGCFSSSGLRSSATRMSGNSQRTQNGSTGGQLRRIGSITNASRSLCRVMVRIASGSRANTPDPEMRSIASFPAALPLAK